MLECVYERVARAGRVDRVIVATDDERISAAACSFGAEVAMTRPDHSTGTERVAEVAAREKAEIIVNVQGDEPLIDPAAIDLAIAPLLDDGATPMATLKKRIADARDLSDPNVVKVVTDLEGNAIYFSRSLIPFPRDAAAGSAGRVAVGGVSGSAAGTGGTGGVAVGGVSGVAARGGGAGRVGVSGVSGSAAGAGEAAGRVAVGGVSAAAASGGGARVAGPHSVAHYKHIGLYVYRREFLLGYPKLQVGPLERAEKLEQLRALENGYTIRVVETDYEAIGVDTPEDLERVRAIVEGARNG